MKGERVLEQVIRTQRAIATADLETVLRTVVGDARALTGADGAEAEITTPYSQAIAGVALESLSAHSIIAVPLLREDQAAGVLKVYSAEHEVFVAEDARVLELLAGLISSALARTELLEETSLAERTDELTGLPNERAWGQRLRAALDRATRDESILTIVIINVDVREDLDDWLEAQTEDRFLRETSLRWASTLRGSDLLARLAENKFGILLSQSDERSALDVVTRLVDTLPAVRDFAVGIAQWDGSEDVDALVARAEASISQNKPSR